ncbi:phage tail assembly chaperone [Peptoniphilus asaccharolyticus]
MNTLQKLMQYDSGTLKMPTGNVKIKLKKLGGEEFDFPITALSPALVSEIQEEIYSVKYKKKSGMEVDITKYQAQLRTIVEGCSIFKDKGLMDKFGAKTPKELVEKLMLSGEMDQLSEAIDDLSGYDEEDDEEDEIKN